MFFKLRNPSVTVATLLFASLLALSACGGGGGGETKSGGDGKGEEGASTINVKLTEFALNADKAKGKTGEVSFELQNIGGEAHEFVIVKTDLAAGALPTKDDGSMNEEGTGVEIVDEVENIPSGEKNQLKASLEAGKYVLVCNLVDHHGAHYKLGMRTAFTVA